MVNFKPSVNKIFKQADAKPNVSFSKPERQSMGMLDDYPVRKAISTKVIETGNHNADGNKPEVVNVVYGVGDPPSADTVPIGTIFIKYS